MKINNKGYTLVELLVSIAIFAVVSIGIVSIMSNSMKAYKSSTLESEVQEEAQIVANQLEELLCDAQGITTTTEGFKFINKDITSTGIYPTYVLVYDVATDPNNKTLRLREYDGSTLLSDSVLVEHVKDFTLLGWGVNSDNKIHYTLTIDEKGKTFTVSRDIYFRNHIENDDAFDIKYLSQNLTTTTTTTGSGAINVFYNRYDELNLTTEYGINYLGDSAHPGGFKKSDGTFDNTTTNSYFTVSVNNNTLTSDANDKVLVLKGSDTLNKTFDSALGGNSVEFVGYKDAAFSDKVVLNLDCKNINIITKNAVYQHQYHESTNNGIHTMITVEGININKAIASGVVIKYTPHMKKSGSTVNGSEKTMTTVTTVNKGENSIHDMPYGNKEVIVGLQPDPFGNGLILCSSNETIESKCNGLQNHDNDYELTFDFSIKNGSVTKTFDDKMKFKFDVLGSGF